MVRLAPSDTRGQNSPDNLAVNGAGDAVLQLQVHFRDCVLGEDGGIGDIPYEHQHISRRQYGHERIAADSTMLRIVKRLMALSLGVQRLQLEQRMGFTWPRPFLLRPLFGSSV
jgi:hypothetical protein